MMWCRVICKGTWIYDKCIWETLNTKIILKCINRENRITQNVQLKTVNTAKKSRRQKMQIQENY